ncbi:hypothetical protein [Bosea sp. (in: a-proteobacteria)]|jgi:alkanesulfonate monooxygenase SsuD/methylene tetrahydromethanopterin reductase-like flavin-dependent oxidoreductase (luciferase family)|uniref:hypothetical protein n=1 Tax=Bosea sp. (in: a-proteobacteria) TaxID=1871050 RepID=UPI003567E983
MFTDILNLPITGSALWATGAYAALSLAVTGPLVAERTIEKSGWVQQCARQGRAAATPPISTPLPRIDCTTVLGAVRGPEGAAFCARHGDVLAMPFELLNALAARPADIARRRAEEQAAKAPAACGCAVAMVIETRRIDFALHAGTARLITPMPVRGLAGELDRARSSSACSVKG